MLQTRTLRIPLLTLAVLAPATALAVEPSIKFVHPRNLMTIVGKTTIELEPRVPPDAEIERVELVINGRETLALTAAPWKIVYEASEEGLPYELTARLWLSDGRIATSTVQTSRLMISQEVFTDLVNLYIVVFDEQGRRVTDLERDAFRIFEDGVEQSVSVFTRLRKPLRTALAIDTSLSMERAERLEKAKRASIAFLDTLAEADQATVVSFGDEVRFGDSFSADRPQLEAQIEALSPRGGTALYDAIWRTSRMLDGFDGRRVMVLLSDGRDEAFDGLGSGSLHTLEEALAQAQYNDVMIFTIGLGRGLEDQYIMRWDGPGTLGSIDRSTSQADLLRHVAESTGGSAVFTASPSNLRSAFDRIAADLRVQYALAYTSTNRTRDGKWRKIRVEIPGTRLRPVTRKGYYAGE